MTGPAPQKQNGPALDLALAREFYDRQRSDAERIMLLVDSTNNLYLQLQEANRKLAAAEARLAALASPAAAQPEGATK